MNVSIDRITLVEDTYGYVGRASNEENAEMFKIEIQKYIEIIDKLINLDFKKLSNREFYELLKQIYSIRLDENDYLKMISKKNGKKYSDIYNIPTTMTFKSMVTEGHGRDFSWYEDLFQTYFDVAISDDLKNRRFQNGRYNLKPFTKQEIKQMLEDKDIVIFMENDRVIYKSDLEEFNAEEYKKFPSLNIECKWYTGNYFKFIEDNFDLFAELLRRKFTKKKILKDMKEYLKELECDIDNIFNNVNSRDKYYSGISKICENWYNTSGIKEKHEDIIKTLSKE